MNKIFYKIIIFMVLLVSCSETNNLDNNIKKTADLKDSELVNKNIVEASIEFDVTKIPFGIVDLKNGGYTNIDNEVIKTLNAYKPCTNSVIDINGNKYYVSSVYTVNIDDENFFDINEHYIYVSLWGLYRDNAYFTAGFYPFTRHSQNINIKPTVNKNMIEFEVLRYADEYEYTDIYKFRIEENHNITQFYLTDFIEESFEEGTNKITSYSFGKDDINMNDITMLFEIDKR